MMKAFGFAVLLAGSALTPALAQGQVAKGGF